MILYLRLSCAAFTPNFVSPFQSSFSSGWHTVLTLSVGIVIFNLSMTCNFSILFLSLGYSTKQDLLITGLQKSVENCCKNSNGMYNLQQRFPTTGTRPGTKTWRRSKWDQKSGQIGIFMIENYIIGLNRMGRLKHWIEIFSGRSTKNFTEKNL